MAKWTTSDIPSLGGRLAIVTGTGGLGYEDALALARAGAKVVIAGRNPKKGADAVARIVAEVGQADVQFEAIDLADLASVSAFAERIATSYEQVDLLINNAGVMVPPKRETTADDFELQMGTNYLGHFALTLHLLPLLRRARGTVVSLSSVAARQGKINFADLDSNEAYDPMAAYAQSKLACLMFALELHRRSVANDWGVKSVAAHPGISRTDLLHNAPGRFSLARLTRTYGWFLFQPASQGALPTLFAATSPESRSGSYYGPGAFGETRGHPKGAQIPSQANDHAISARLWQVSEHLTGTAA